MAMFQSSSCVLTKHEGRHHCLPSHHPGNHLLADIGALVPEAEQLCSPKWHSTPESGRWQQREMRMTQRPNNRTKATVNKKKSGATSEIQTPEKSNVWPGFYSGTRSGRSCRRSDQSWGKKCRFVARVTKISALSIGNPPRGPRGLTDTQKDERKRRPLTPRGRHVTVPVRSSEDRAHPTCCGHCWSCNIAHIVGLSPILRKLSHAGMRCFRWGCSES